MGFFDRFTAKKTEPAPDAPAPVPTGPLARLAAAREKLDAKDLPAALAIYEEVLATAGDRADVLVTISGDLGSRGHIAEIIELIAPRYDAERHGPATGINLLQAYLAAHNAEAAQHVLDILFALNRPELEERLHGFSNALAEILHAQRTGAAPGGPVPPGVEVPKVGLITISKPIWFYGLEPLAAQLLPPKDGRLRRLAFAQLALPGLPDVAAAMKKPEDELGRLARALPLWLAETFYFSPSYAPVAAIGLMHPPGAPALPMLFGGEWTLENLRQLVDTTEGGLDYIVTGALRAVDADYEVMLRVWEVKTYRERKTFSARWAPATADAALAQLRADVCAYMEWSPASAALAYVPPAKPRAWLDTLGASLGLFLVEKGILGLEFFTPPAAALTQIAPHAAGGEIASLTFLTLRARAARHGAAPPAGVALARSPLVAQASSLLA